jgi:hypothetical protein
VIIGTGEHGTEMLKALTWFCQMDGYRVSIDAFDQDPLVKSRFTAKCPELMDKKYNGVYVDGEAQYLINIHDGINVDTVEFMQEIKKLMSTTYVFVSLDSDAKNIQCAVTLRMLFEQMGIHPVIHAVVYDSDKKHALHNITNYRGQSYDIELVGDLETLYSENVIINSELEQEALQRHLKWGNEAEFWTYEYNYNSSMTSALHRKARIACQIPGAEKKKKI